MADVGFADLVLLYRHIRFDGQGGGTLHLADQRIVETLAKVEVDEATYDLTQISQVEPRPLVVGDDVSVNVATPNGRLGRLVENFDGLFRAPGAAFAEPTDYFVIDSGYAFGDQPPPEALARYRALLDVVAILREAASYVGILERELVFIDDEKTVVPIMFSAADLPAGLPDNAARLRRIFTDPLHGDEKTELVSAAVIENTRSVRRAERFRHLITHLDQVCEEVEKGYRLFVSSFSYSKIRKEIETGRLEYVGKIHKTIVDIQGQLLGIPVATIVVASQMKRPDGCDLAFWTNAAVILGAWIFVGLLVLAVINQWHTLNAIGAEVAGYKLRLERDHAAVQRDFVGLFTDLERRVTWHRWVLGIVLLVAMIGAGGATVAWLMLTPQSSVACLPKW